MFYRKSYYRKFMSVHHVMTKRTWPAEDYAALKRSRYLYVRQKSIMDSGYLLALARTNTSCDSSPGLRLGWTCIKLLSALASITVRFSNKKREQIGDAAEAALLAFRFSEPNDRVLFGSISEARPEDGGAYRFITQESLLINGQILRRWFHLGKQYRRVKLLSVFAYLTPDKETSIVKDDWIQACGATQSNSVELKGIYAAEEQILTKVASDQASIQWYSVFLRN